VAASEVAHREEVDAQIKRHADLLNGAETALGADFDAEREAIDMLV
jgi:hypothetical protein